MGEVRDRGSNAIFTIRAQQDIVELIEILSKYPLNSAAPLKKKSHLLSSSLKDSLHHYVRWSEATCFYV